MERPQLSVPVNPSSLAQFHEKSLRGVRAGREFSDNNATRETKKIIS